MQTPNGEGYYRALFSASVTLTLAILGRSVLLLQTVYYGPKPVIW